MGLRSYMEWRLWAEDEVVRRAKARIGDEEYYAREAAGGVEGIAFLVGFFVVLFLYGPVAGAVAPSVQSGVGVFVLLGYMAAGLAFLAIRYHRRLGVVLREARRSVYVKDGRWGP